MGGGGKGAGQTIGFRYYMTLHMGICRGPIDEIVQIDVGGLRAFPYAEGKGPGQKGESNGLPEPDDPNEPGVDFINKEMKCVAEGPADSAIIHYVDGTAQTTTSLIRNTIRYWGDQYRIHAGDLFGGDEKEGSISGSMAVNMGSENTDNRTWYAAKSMPGLIAGFLGVTTILYDGLLTSLNPYPKKWSFRVRRTNRGWEGATWNPSQAAIWLRNNTIKSMNGAHIIYECLTNKTWGRGLPASELLTATFLAAAQTMVDENFGLCLKWTRQTPLDEFIGVVIDHIGASLYVDRATGKIGLKLLRADYDPATVPLYTYDSGLLAVSENETSTQDGAINEVVVKWFDPTTATERESRVHNLAAMQTLGGKNSTNVQYPGLATSELATRVAQRDLRVGAMSLKRYKVELDRRAWELHPGAVFRIRADELGITNVVLRAGKVDESSGTDGKITVEAVMDVFGLPSSSFAATNEPTWHEGSKRARPVPVRIIRDATYPEMVRNIDPANLKELDDTSAFLTTIAVKPSSMSLGYRIAATSTGNDFEGITGSGSFNSIAALENDIEWNESINIAYESGYDMGLVTTGMVAEIGNEICTVKAISSTSPLTGVLELNRGCGDTIPEFHAAGTPILFYAHGTTGRNEVEYVRGESIDVKLLTFTSSRKLDLEEAPTDTVVMNGRFSRPYPPAKVEVNGANYPNITSAFPLATNLVIRWRHRNRLVLNDRLIPWSNDSTSLEPGSEYRLSVYVGGSATGTPARVEVGMTNREFTYTPAMATADGVTGLVTFKLESIRGTEVSLFNHTFTIARA